MDSVVRHVDGDESLAEIAQRGLARSDLRFGEHDTTRPALRVDHLAVLDLVLHLAQSVHAGGSATDSQLGLLGHLDLGEQGARRRIPTGEIDARRLTDQTAPAVASDEILRPHALAVGQRDVDAGVVLREACDLASAIERHGQLADPGGEDALDVGLPQPESVWMPGGKDRKSTRLNSSHSQISYAV